MGAPTMQWFNVWAVLAAISTASAQCIDLDPTCPGFIAQHPEVCASGAAAAQCELSCNVCSVAPSLVPTTHAPSPSSAPTPEVEAVCIHDGITLFADAPGCGRIASSSGVVVACADSTYSVACPATCNPCENHAPTASPTFLPTTPPSVSPSAVPTTQPTTSVPTSSPTAEPTFSPSAAPTVSSCNGVDDPAICSQGLLVNCTVTAFADVCRGQCGTCLPIASCNGVPDPTICRDFASVRNCSVVGAGDACPGRCGTCIPASVCNAVIDPPSCQDHTLGSSCATTAGFAAVCPGRCGTCTVAPSTAPTSPPLPLQSCAGVLDPAGMCENPTFVCGVTAGLATTCPARCNNCPDTTTLTTATASTQTATSTATTITVTTGHFGCNGAEDPTFCERDNFDCATAGAQFWCPVKCDTCAGARITRPPSAAPTTAAPSASPTVAPTSCASILCSNDCRFGCGWSRRSSACIVGGRTTASEANLGACAGLVNCASILCSNNCSGACGWSRTGSVCKTGGRTTASEVNLGTCAGTGATPAPTPQALNCASFTCSNDCTGACGWSSRSLVCKHGGRTTASESNLGTGCT